MENILNTEMLRAENLGISYGKYTIIKNVSFNVLPSQWLMVAGPNGAGKSTVLNAISGGIAYTGKVSLLGEDVLSLSPKKRARLMGMLAQSNHVGYSFSVEEVVRLGRYAYSKDFLDTEKRSETQIVADALSAAGLYEIRHQSVLTLSGGELQRTFLAQLFAQNPKILLLDEPTNHLDPAYQKQVFELVKNWLKAPGRAVVSVVHDISFAKKYGTHALLLNGTKTQPVFGTVGEVLSNENLNEVYGMDMSLWMKDLLGQWN